MNIRRYAFAAVAVATAILIPVSASAAIPVNSPIVNEDYYSIPYARTIPAPAIGQITETTGRTPEWQLTNYNTPVQAGTQGYEQKLIFQHDGNLVLYSYRTSSPGVIVGSGTAVWSSHTSCGCAQAHYTIRFQTDGNVVIYNSANVAKWATGTNKGKGDAYLFETYESHATNCVRVFKVQTNNAYVKEWVSEPGC